MKILWLKLRTKYLKQQPISKIITQNLKIKSSKKKETTKTLKESWNLTQMYCASQMEDQHECVPAGDGMRWKRPRIVNTVIS